MRKGNLILPLTAVLLVMIAAAPLTAATTGFLRGTVADEDTGKVLSGVNISLENTKLTTVTDVRGEYSFINIAPGRYHVNASLVGYAPGKSTNIDVVMDQTTRADIKLKATEEEEPEVIVSEDRIVTTPDTPQSLYTLDAKDQILTKSQPNSFNQANSLVASVPGVVQDNMGDIHIRGGDTDQIGWMIEGIPVTTPLDMRFGTSLTTIGMSRMEVYTGGYPAEYGSAISGVLNEVKLKGSDIRGSRVEGTLGSTALSSFYGETGNVNKKGLEWYLANYTWTSDFDKTFFSRTAASDTVMKVVVPHKKDKITLLGMTGTGKFVVPETPPVTNTSGETLRYALGAITLDHQMTAKTHWLIRPWYFLSRVDIRAVPTSIGYDAKTSSLQRGVQAELRGESGSRNQYALGGMYISSSNADQFSFPSPGTGIPDFLLTSNVSGRQSSLFAQDTLRLSNTLTMDAGVRYDQMRYIKRVNPNSEFSQVSPRFGLSWSKNPKTVWKASIGRFIQFAPTMQIDKVYNDVYWTSSRILNEDLKPMRATSLDLTWERQPAKDTLVRVTPFYRTYNNVISDVPNDPTDPSSAFIIRNAEKAEAKGIELFLQRKMGPRTRGWVSYTISDAKMSLDFDPKAWTYLSWDQRHTVDATLVHNCGDTEIATRLQWRTGQPYTSSTDVIQNASRMKDLFITSLNITRNLEKSPLKGKVTLSIYNLFNDTTPTSIDTSDTVQSYNMPRFYSVSVSRSW